MKILSRKKIIIISSIILAILISLILPLCLWFGKTGQDTKILGKNYSLLNKSEILQKLDLDFPRPQNITLVYEDRTFDLDTQSISLQLNKDQIASNLLYRRLNKGIIDYFLAFFKPKNFELTYDYNQEKLTEFLDQISNQIDKPYIPSELIINQHKNIEVKIGEVGQEVNQEFCQREIDDLLSHYNINQQISIPVVQIGALPQQSTIEQALNSAQKIVGKNIELITPTENIKIEDDVLISWLDFNFSCRHDRVKEYVFNFNESFKTDPVDAVFKFENDQVLEFQPAQKGQEIDIEKLEYLICRRLADILNISDLSLQIETPIIYTEPNINNSQVNDLGIKELLGSGTSTFRHSSTIRNLNIERGAEVINHVLVPPGETFSFVQSLGEVSLATGFKKAYVIRQGRTEIDVGGGVCQVSTTLFRAIINSGLNLIERRAHAYRVSYYEEDSKPGFDATVYIPKPDLRFINDTSYHLLIQNTYDGVNKRLTYDIYGTSDGSREVTIDNYRQWGTAPPPPDKYIDDPSLPPGKIIQDEQRIPGLKTAFDWTVKRDGEILHQQTITSNYVPWGAVYRRGPSQ
jgi:vancomycin resistance protein YoaR